MNELEFLAVIRNRCKFYETERHELRSTAIAPTRTSHAGQPLTDGLIRDVVNEELDVRIHEAGQTQTSDDLITIHNVNGNINESNTSRNTVTYVGETDEYVTIDIGGDRQINVRKR